MQAEQLCGVWRSQVCALLHWLATVATVWHLVPCALALWFCPLAPCGPLVLW